MIQWLNLQMWNCRYRRMTVKFYMDFWLVLGGSMTLTSTYFKGQLLNKSVAAVAKSLQSCLTLCDPIDGSPLGSPVPGILQARTLEWVVISFSNAWKWKVKVKLLSRARLLATSWTAAYQAPPSMGFSRQEYWSGLPLPSPNESVEHLKSRQKVNQIRTRIGEMSGSHWCCFPKGNSSWIHIFLLWVEYS